MFKKDGEKFVLDAKKKKTTWVAGDAAERAKLLNDAEDKKLEVEVRFDLLRVDTEEDAVIDEVVPGTYRLFNGSYGSPEALIPLPIAARNYPSFPEAFGDLDTELEWFRNSSSFFSEIGIRRSRSVLLWGPPGFSKTAKIHDLVLNAKDFIVVFMSAPPSAEMVVALNNTKRDKIVIFEEFATAVNNDGKIATMLNFLDGDNSLSDAFFIITTNHPEIIPRNILRPSRVDKFIKIDKLSTVDIKNFIKFYLKRDATASEVAIMRTQSLANLREICLSSLKESKSLEDSVKILKSREELLKKDFANPKKVGLVDADDYPDY